MGFRKYKPIHLNMTRQKRASEESRDWGSTLFFKSILSYYQQDSKIILVHVLIILKENTFIGLLIDGIPKQAGQNRRNHQVENGYGTKSGWACQPPSPTQQYSQSIINSSRRKNKQSWLTWHIYSSSRVNKRWVGTPDFPFRAGGFKTPCFFLFSSFSPRLTRCYLALPSNAMESLRYHDLSHLLILVDSLTTLLPFICLCTLPSTRPRSHQRLSPRWVDHTFQHILWLYHLEGIKPRQRQEPTLSQMCGCRLLFASRYPNQPEDFHSV